MTTIKTIQQMIQLNLDTLSELRDGKIDHELAADIFNGSKSTTGAIRVQLEHAKSHGMILENEFMNTSDYKKRSINRD